MLRQVLVWNSVLSIFVLFLVSGLSRAGDKDSAVYYGNVQSYLQQGQLHMHMRVRSMATINQKTLTDYAAMGIGAGLSYVSPYFHQFQFGFSGFFTFNVFSWNLSTTDTQTGIPNRYEIMLFDGTDPENRHDLDRMEELYMKFTPGKWEFVVGRQYIETPLANKQDNRMRPNLFEGLWVSFQQNKHAKASVAWFTGASPRATVKWYAMAESIGVYAAGRHLNGNPSSYHGKLSSAGLGIFNYQWRNEKQKWQLWNYYADNLFNISMIQADFSAKDRWSAGLQALYQTAVGSGGTTDLNAVYIAPDNNVWLWGSFIGYNGARKHQLSLNYLGIGSGGRFLFPREWGREQFFANLPRDRFEGNGGVQAFSLKYEGNYHNRLEPKLGVGYFIYPDVLDFRLNKYGMPSYIHYLAAFNYALHKVFEGVELQFMAVYKQNVAEVYGDKRFIINKANLMHFDLMLDYHF